MNYSHTLPIKQHAFPCALLQPYIDRYWSWEGDTSQIPTLPRMLPGAGKELVLHYEIPFAIERLTGCREQLPQAHMICLRTQTASLSPGTKTGFISIRFKTGAFGHFCDLPAKSITDSFIDAPLIFGDSIRILNHKIIEAKTFHERVALIEPYMLALLHVGSKHQAFLYDAVQALYYGHAFIRPKDVSQHLGVGERQLQRIFKEEMGVGPKQFIRLSRFQNTAKDLLLARPNDTLKVALEHGYYDQSHFIRDFKHFVGETPLAFLNSQDSMTHFYNTSRHKNA